jgi:hypothetical protein
MEYMPRERPFGAKGYKPKDRISEIRETLENTLAFEGPEGVFNKYREYRAQLWPTYPNGQDPMPDITRDYYEPAKQAVYNEAIRVINARINDPSLINYIDEHPAYLAFGDIQQFYNTLKQKQPRNNEFDGLTPVQIFEKYRANRSVYSQNQNYVNIYEKAKGDMYEEGMRFIQGKSPRQIVQFFNDNPNTYGQIQQLIELKIKAENDLKGNVPPPPPPPPPRADARAQADKQAEADRRAQERFAKQRQQEEEAAAKERLRKDAEKQAPPPPRQEAPPRQAPPQPQAPPPPRQEAPKPPQAEAPENCPARVVDTNHLSKDVHCFPPIKRKQLLLKLHPDKNSGCVEEAKEKFQAATNFCDKFKGGKRTKEKTVRKKYNKNKKSNKKLSRKFIRKNKNKRNKSTKRK